MRGGRNRLVVFAAALVLSVGLVVWLAQPFLSTAALLLDLAEADGWARRLLPAGRADVTSSDVTVPTRTGAVPARLYRTGPAAGPTVVVFPGVHAGGVDEPRLSTFARRLAASGGTVLSVPLPDLRAYRITTASTDVIEDAVLWLAGDRELAPAGRVGVIGVSFSGGLALVAAGRPSIRDKVTAVISLGGHADLPRVMTYLCSGRLPDGTTRPPHDYGVAIILRAAIPQLVPHEQAAPLDAALVAFLDGSSYAAFDPDRAATLFAASRAAGDRLAEPARTLLGWVSDRNVAALGSRLLPLAEALGGHPALSPERSPAARAPVFILHGREDNVIPSFEAPRLLEYLGHAGNTRVRALLTPLVSHAHLTPSPSLADSWRLVRFWTAAWLATN